MRITLKKVIAYIVSVCIIDSVILCIYVSTNNDKRSEFLQFVAESRQASDDKTYFIKLKEPHLERLIKEYRNQEEYPGRFVGEAIEELLNDNYNSTSEKYQKLKLDNESNVNRFPTSSRHTVHEKNDSSHNNHRQIPVSPNKGIDNHNIRKTDINESELKQVEVLNDENMQRPVKRKNDGEQSKLPVGVKIPVNAKIERHQNKPIYVKYVKLANNELQPIPIHQPGNIRTDNVQKTAERISSGVNTVKLPTNIVVDRTSKSSGMLTGEINLDNVYLAVKTTQKYHKSRLQVLLDTWVSLVPNQVYFFTDADDEEFHRKTNGHMINTKCPSLHVRRALCCKMTVMFDAFMSSNKSWFCHVDDDNYLNLKELKKLLNLYNPEHQDVYLGRSSTSNPIEAYTTQQRFQFWFATGGAGVCISRVLAEKMVPYVSGGKMLKTCESIRMPDDVTIGYINEILLNVPMVHIRKMNSHLQDLWSIRQTDIKNQITLSYRIDNRNKIAIKSPAFTDSNDPTRFKSIHCILYPDSNICPDWLKR